MNVKKYWESFTSLVRESYAAFVEWWAMDIIACHVALDRHNREPSLMMDIPADETAVVDYVEPLELHKRVKILSVDVCLVVDILNWCNNPSEYLALPKTEELPEGTVILDATCDLWRNTLDLKVCHESWPKTVPGAQIERIPKVFEHRDFHHEKTMPELTQINEESEGE